MELPADSQAAAQLKAELQNVQSSSPLPVQYTSLHSFKGSSQGYQSNMSSLLGRCAAVTGKLEVRLMGCQNLLEDVPGRSRTSPGDLKSLVKGISGRSSSKSYSVKDETSNEIMAVIKLDNTTVAQTSWKPCSQQAWDQRFSIDLEKSRELEIGIFWRDWRSLCAVKFLRLEEFVDDIRHGMALELEPQGLLFAEIKFINPMISRRPKLQRQRMIFKGAQVRRATQMKIDFATWGRLLKRNQALAISTSKAGTPTATTPATPTSPAYIPGVQPLDVEAAENEPQSTLGEKPNNQIVGLSGGRPLSIHGVPPPVSKSHQNLTSRDELPPKPAHMTSISTPTSFKQIKKPPMPAPPPPPMIPMAVEEQEVSCTLGDWFSV